MPINSVKQLLQELWNNLEREEPAWYTVARHRALHLVVYGEPCSCHPSPEPLVLFDLPVEPAMRETKELPPGDYVVVQVEIAAPVENASDGSLEDEMSALLSESCWRADSPLRDWQYSGPRWLVHADATLDEGEVFCQPRTPIQEAEAEHTKRRWVVTLYTPAMEVEVIAADEAQARGLATADPEFSQALDLPLGADDGVIVNAQETEDDEEEDETALYCDCPESESTHTELWEGVELLVCEQCNRPLPPGEV